MQKVKLGDCESCHAKFEYYLIHNGFGDSAYAYCDKCGMTAIVGGWDDNAKPAQAPLKVQGPIQVGTEPWLQPCECGGSFRAQSSPRCPYCKERLSAEIASEYIERQAPGTKRLWRWKWGWRWQRNWQGMYCIVIGGRRIDNNWRSAPKDFQRKEGTLSNGAG
jgi:hypothetical protein